MILGGKAAVISCTY